MADLDAIEARLWAVLGRHRPPLVDATIYRMPSLIWPGATGHSYFAAVKRASKHVGLFMIVMDHHPDELEACSPALLKRRTGKSTLQFSTWDDEIEDELQALVDRLFVRYRADHEQR